MEPFAAYLLVGIVIVSLGIIITGKGSKKKKRCTATASAVIVEIEKQEDSVEGNTRKSYAYTPIYEFTVNGTTIRKSGGIYSNNKNKYKVGDVSPVTYNPENPEEFLVNGKNGGNAFGIALLLFGIVIIAIAFTQL